MELLDTKTLRDLILDEKNKVPNIEGNTPLILRAIANSKLDNLSKEKEKLEDEVCRLVGSFHEFNQIHFTELDSYITVSKFNLQKILKSFGLFIKEKQKDEDLILKGCVLRFIQSFNESLFQLDYIKERFYDLKEIDPWLYAELVINVNWDEGMDQMATILRKNNDTNYLFMLISGWMDRGISKINMERAFEKWVNYFSDEDKELLEEFCTQYSYNMQYRQLVQSPRRANYLDEILKSPGFNQFRNNRSNKKFEQIPS